jgi:methanogenic corrinoid protein MtbC1/CRP-like cAMP-binding protein
MAKIESAINDLACDIWPDRKKHYPRGAVLLWQGDPVEQIYLILSGAVKVSAISPEGKIYAYGILGAGRLIGARTYLLGGVYESVAEVSENTELLVIPQAEFDRALRTNQDFSRAVMKEMAREASVIAGNVRDLSFLDVQQRLKHSLMNLAREHGIRTERGVIIDLNITQDEIGTMVSANRTTIAACLSELRAKGFLWKDGRHLAILPPEHVEKLDALTLAVVEGDDQGAEKLANEAITEGIDALKVLEALTAGMKEVDRAYSRGEIDLPDIVLAATAMKQALPVIEANIELGRKQEMIVGTVIIGTVFGDIHDIGKTIVAMLLRARNFRVIDLGVNIKPEQFVEATARFTPDILALSASTTSTSLEIDPVIRLLTASGLRTRIKLMVGGGAMSEEYATRIGADGYHASAQGAVETAWRLCTGDKTNFDQPAASNSR